jgi:hypothetical protein
MIINELIFEDPQAGDALDLELGDTLIETVIDEVRLDGIVIRLDETALQLIVDARRVYVAESEVKRVKQSEVERTINDLHQKYKEASTDDERDAIAKQIQDYTSQKRAIVPDDWELEEAKYQGREVPLGKPMAGDVKKSKVYIKGPKGNVVKVNFGDKKMKIKKSNPKRRKSFRARHNCDNPGPRWKARYWSCRAW